MSEPKIDSTDVLASQEAYDTDLNTVIYAANLKSKHLKSPKYQKYRKAKEIADSLGSLSARREAMIQVLSAVACMRRAGLTHRDLKPENILVKIVQVGEDSDGTPIKKPKLVLNDFGTVTPIGASLKGNTLAGTYKYLDPKSAETILKDSLYGDLELSQDLKDQPKEDHLRAIAHEIGIDLSHAMDESLFKNTEEADVWATGLVLWQILKMKPLSFNFSKKMYLHTKNTWHSGEVFGQLRSLLLLRSPLGSKDGQGKKGTLSVQRLKYLLELIARIRQQKV